MYLSAFDAWSEGDLARKKRGESPQTGEYFFSVTTFFRGMNASAHSRPPLQPSASPPSSSPHAGMPVKMSGARLDEDDYADIAR